MGSVQFRPYFLVFFLVVSIIYAALLHPKESLSLGYGLVYSVLFPAMFIILPAYSLANMLDQSWGTREVRISNVMVKRRKLGDQIVEFNITPFNFGHSLQYRQLFKHTKTVLDNARV